MIVYEELRFHSAAAGKSMENLSAPWGENGTAGKFTALCTDSFKNAQSAGISAYARTIRFLSYRIQLKTMSES